MIEYGCTNTNPCQKVKTQWTWRVISIIAENKPHAHHKTHFHTMKGFNARPVYSLSIEVFWLKYSLVPKLSTLSSDPIEFVDRPVPEKLDNSASIFPKLSSQIEHGAVTRSNSYPQFPRSPLVTPGTLIPLLARTLARLTTYCAGLCFKSLASRFFYGEQVPSLSSEDSL